MAAHDIEESVQTALTGYARHTGMTLTRDFVMEAPVKVLYRLTQLAMKAWEDSQDFSGDDQCRQGIDLKEENSDDERKLSKQERDPEKATSTKRPKVVTTQASDVPSKVATKNDDAPVEVTDWDIWTVDSYQHPEFLTTRAGAKGTTGFKIKNPARVLICKPGGTYLPDTHGRLFDAMQALLLQ